METLRLLLSKLIIWGEEAALKGTIFFFFFKNSFTHHTVHPFTGYNSVALYLFTELGNRHHSRF